MWVPPLQLSTWCYHYLHGKIDLAEIQIEAENLADISESFDIEAVPSFLLIRVSGSFR